MFHISPPVTNNNIVKVEKNGLVEELKTENTEVNNLRGKPFILSELHKNIHVTLTKRKNSDSTFYTKSVKVDGRIYSAGDVSTKKAKQKNYIPPFKKFKSDDKSKDEEVKNKWPLKHKNSKQKRKKFHNAKIEHFVRPKTPLTVFTELYQNVPVKLEHHRQNGIDFYSAIIEFDDEVYTENHMSSNTATQMVCENVLRILFTKKMNDNLVQIGEEGVASKNKTVVHREPPKDDFLWSQFVSLAMHKLITQWNIQSPNLFKFKIQSQCAGMKIFPNDPIKYHPVQLLYHMIPSIIMTTTDNYIIQMFEVTCEVEGKKFIGEGKSKREAKRECAIKTIKHFWNFDYYALR